MNWIAIAIVVGSLLLSLAVIGAVSMLVVVLGNMTDRIEEQHHMTFAVRAMMLTLELADREYEIPSWLKEMFTEEEDEEEAGKEEEPKLSLVKIPKIGIDASEE